MFARCSEGRADERETNAKAGSEIGRISRRQASVPVRKCCLGRSLNFMLVSGSWRVLCLFTFAATRLNGPELRYGPAVQY